MPRNRSLLTVAALAALVGMGVGAEPPRRSERMPYVRNGAFGGRKGGRRKSQGKRRGRGRR
jgi:hypothetical protein